LCVCVCGSVTTTNWKLRASILTKLGLWVKVVNISSWLNFGRPACALGKGVCGGSKFFYSTLLQPARSVCASLSAFSFPFYISYLALILHSQFICLRSSRWNLCQDFKLVIACNGVKVLIVPLRKCSLTTLLSFQLFVMLISFSMFSVLIHYHYRLVFNWSMCPELSSGHAEWSSIDFPKANLWESLVQELLQTGSVPVTQPMMSKQ